MKSKPRIEIRASEHDCCDYFVPVVVLGHDFGYCGLCGKIGCLIKGKIENENSQILE